jgi:hypothetical protein
VILLGLSTSVHPCCPADLGVIPSPACPVSDSSLAPVCLAIPRSFVPVASNQNVRLILGYRPSSCEEFLLAPIHPPSGRLLWSFSLGCWLFHWIIGSFGFCGWYMGLCGWLWVNCLGYVYDLDGCLSSGGDLLFGRLG